MSSDLYLLIQNKIQVICSNIIFLLTHTIIERSDFMQTKNDKAKSVNKTSTQNISNENVKNGETHKPSTHTGIDRERRDGPGGS